jgi:hypothetical protein
MTEELLRRAKPLAIAIPVDNERRVNAIGTERHKGHCVPTSCGEPAPVGSTG